MQGYVKESADRLRQYVEQFGAKMAALGTTGNYDILPVAKGGTGSDNATAARTNLGLGTAATRAVGFAQGQVPPSESIGLVGASSTTKSWYTDLDQGFDPVLYAPGAPGAPSGGTGYWYKQTIRFGANNNRLMIAWPYGLSGNTGTIKMWSVYGDGVTPVIELYHTGNTTRASDGTLKAI
uniref:hypothetical protein n=1 Tax=Pseudomonas sp. REB1044 TaxID=2675224 RepID=UPI00406D48EA